MPLRLRQPIKQYGDFRQYPYPQLERVEEPVRGVLARISPRRRPQPILVRGTLAGLRAVLA